MNGTYDDVNRLASEIAGEEEGWAFVNVNVRPFYAEGSKTLGYEIAEQLGWRLPDQVVIPVASGSQLTKVDKSFQELIKLGLVEDKPYKIFGAQATGCSPVSAAFKDGHQIIRPVKPDTIAKSLAIGNPADGIYVLDICRRTGGAIEDITDEEVREGILLLARTEGIFTETAGGTTVGVPEEARRDRASWIPKLETVVINTGMGLKTLDAISDRVGPAATIDPSYAAFTATGIASLHKPTSPRSHMSVSRPDPHHPPQLHRRRVRGVRRWRDPVRGAGLPRRVVRRNQGPDRRRGRRAAPLRQRVRRQRRRALPGEPQHRHSRRHPDLGHPGRRRRLALRPLGVQSKNASTSY